jgi:hypothetical protein
MAERTRGVERQKGRIPGGEHDRIDIYKDSTTKSTKYCLKMGEDGRRLGKHNKGGELQSIL